MHLDSLQLHHDQLSLKMKARIDTAKTAEGGWTKADEDAHAADLKSLDSLEQRMTKTKSDADFMKQLDSMMTNSAIDGAVERHVDRRLTTKSLGQQFLESKAGEALKDLAKTGWPRHWSSGTVELKATLTEDPASGGALNTPQTLPTIVPGPLAAPTVAQLFPPGTATTGIVSFMRELVFTDASAPVAEGTAKPESTLTFEAVSAPLAKIATWLPVTTELLEDQAQMRSYIDSRLRAGVNLALDDQILNGTGVAPEMLGLNVRTDLSAPIAATLGGSLDAIAEQIAAVQVASQLEVTGIVMHPTDFVKLTLTKTNATDNTYLGASPFSTPVQPTLWGRRVAFSLKQPLGTCIVGAFSQGGQLFQKGGVRVEASNSHQDFFIKNLVAILAEVRALAAIYRPQGFAKVTGLNALA